jgi:hypothetical protein
VWEGKTKPVIMSIKSLDGFCFSRKIEKEGGNIFVAPFYFS